MRKQMRMFLVIWVLSSALAPALPVCAFLSQGHTEEVARLIVRQQLVHPEQLEESLSDITVVPFFVLALLIIVLTAYLSMNRYFVIKHRSRGETCTKSPEAEKWSTAYFFLFFLCFFGFFPSSIREGSIDVAFQNNRRLVFKPLIDLVIPLGVLHQSQTSSPSDVTYPDWLSVPRPYFDRIRANPLREYSFGTSIGIDPSRCLIIESGGVDFFEPSVSFLPLHVNHYLKDCNQVSTVILVHYGYVTVETAHYTDGSSGTRYRHSVDMIVVDVADPQSSVPITGAHFLGGEPEHLPRMLSPIHGGDFGVFGSEVSTRVIENYILETVGLSGSPNRFLKKQVYPVVD